MMKSVSSEVRGRVFVLSADVWTLFLNNTNKHKENQTNRHSSVSAGLRKVLEKMEAGERFSTKTSGS